MSVSDGDYDVVVVGGGWAGLTLTRQLQLRRPGTTVLVAERNRHPVPEAAHKVGEATVEMSAQYLGEVLELHEHLARTQYRKMGLRFFPAASTPPPPLSQRTEAGPSEFLPRMTYQLDRGRFENTLAEIVAADGADFYSGCRATEIALDRAGHTVRLVDEDGEATVSCRWLVDASGRAGVLKNKLGLRAEAAHDCNAVWFRLSEPIEMDDLIEYERPQPSPADAEAWRARVPSGERWRSTNHLMGRGYWVWLIPLASGSTSVGLVADPAHVPFERVRSFDGLLGWLHEHEPELGRAVEERREALQDFRYLKHFAHGCEQVYSADRWALTGEAGVFNDPLYSPGGNFIALSNSLVTELILRDFEGVPLEHMAPACNQFYLDAYAKLMPVWEGQYGLMGNPQVWSAKCVWDIFVYMAVSGLVYSNGALTDLFFMASVADRFDRIDAVNHRLQTFFREWDEAGPASDVATFFDVGAGLIPEYADALNEAVADRDALRERLAENIGFAEDVARVLMAGAARRLGREVAAAEVDPARFRLDGEEEAGPGVPERQDSIERAEALLETLWHEPLAPAASG